MFCLHPFVLCWELPHGPPIWPCRGQIPEGKRSIPLTCIVGLLTQLGPAIETQLKPNLTGLMGIIVRGYLPQVWVFSTGMEYASLVVDNQGNVETRAEAVEPTDVLITTTHDVLSTALEAANGLRSRDAVMTGPITPQFYTSKGQMAFNYLRQRLGL